jgi:hypothetical protein
MPTFSVMVVHVMLQVLHRDLKSANVLICERHVAKVMFGSLTLLVYCEIACAHISHRYRSHDQHTVICYISCMLHLRNSCATSAWLRSGHLLPGQQPTTHVRRLLAPMLGQHLSFSRVPVLMQARKSVASRTPLQQMCTALASSSTRYE